MGIGDQLMATGMARGAAKRGKRIAFGDGLRIRWDQHSELVFRHNPNIAKPGQENSRTIEWIAYYKGNRIYNRVNDARDRWVWNYDFKAVPGEVFLSPAEVHVGRRYGKGFVLIEPYVVNWKSSAVNKDWGIAKYQEVAVRLRAAGHEVRQFSYPGGGGLLPGANMLATRSFRDALCLMANAALYVGPEGGLHHAAAAFGLKAVVLFGGFVPPAVTGYDDHTNLTGGVEACGSLHACEHCRQAMAAISVEEVTAAALGHLKKGKS